mgnify:CR=1 FL=1
MDPDRIVTQADVAALAGVSQATASRAISGCAPVAADTKAKIVAAAMQLGYVRIRALPARDERAIATRVRQAEQDMRTRVAARLRGIATMHHQHIKLATPARRCQLEIEIAVLRQVAEMIETSADVKYR